MKILLVEDDPRIGQLISTTLIAHRYTVDIATDGQIGMELAIQKKYDIILLNVIVPKLDGLSVCRQLRQQGCQTPILMLTEKDSDEDVITGLDAGADDYVTKPCESARLIARVRALLRRQGNVVASPVMTWGALRLDPTLIQVTYQQQVIVLGPKEYSLLELFLRHPQRIFSRSSIIDRLWSVDDSPTDAAVTNLIKDLRRKLKVAGMTEELIETVYRLGYRLRIVAGEQRRKKDRAQEGLVVSNQVKPDFQASLAERVEVLERAVQALLVGNLSLAQRQPVSEEGPFGYVQNSDLAKAIQLLTEEVSLIDPLTQVASQRYFDEFLEQQWLRLARAQAPLSLILCSVDHFKSYNSFYGHQAGDSCLQQLTNVLQECIDASYDLLARYGGDEFAIALLNTSLNDTLPVVERIRQVIAGLQIPHAFSPTSRYITLSLGITGTVPSGDKSPKDLMAIATQALYAAKARGHNTYCLYPS